MGDRGDGRTAPGRANPYRFLPALLGAAWIVAAYRRPAANYYLFPVLIAAAVPLSFRIHRGRPLSPAAATAGAVAGVVNVVLVSLLLALTGRLQGTPLLPVGGLVIEALVLGTGAGLLAALIASRIFR